MYGKDKEWAKWVLGYTEGVGGIDKAVEFAGLLKKTIYPVIMDGKVPNELGITSNPVYISAAKYLWSEYFGEVKEAIPASVIDDLSRDLGAPWTVFSVLKSIAYEQGYKGGNKDLDDIAADLALGGALH
jgi:hypothetical protein